MADRTVTVKLVIDTSDVAPSLAEIGRAFGKSKRPGTRQASSDDTLPDGLLMRSERRAWALEDKSFADAERRRKVADAEMDGEVRRKIREADKVAAEAERRARRAEAEADRLDARARKRLPNGQFAPGNGGGGGGSGGGNGGGGSGGGGGGGGNGSGGGGNGGSGGGGGGNGGGGPGGGNGGGGSPGGGGGWNFNMGGFGTALKGIAWTAAADQTEKLVRAYTKLQQNPYLSDTQRMMRLVDEIPIVGSRIMDMAKTYSGYNAQLALIGNEINPMAMLQVEKNIKQSNVGFDFQLQLRQRQSEAAAMQGYRAVGLPTGDRMTQFGRREYEETSRLQGPTQQLELEQRKLVAATRNRAIIEDALSKTDSELVMLNKIRANAIRVLTKTDGDDRLKLLQKADVDRAEMRFDNAQKRRQEILDRRNAAAYAQDAAKLAVEQAQIGIKEATAANSQQRAETAYANRMRLLNMGFGGRRMVENAFNILEGYGKQAAFASPEVIQQARGFSPQAVDEILGKAAGEDPFFARNQHRQGLEDPAELFKKADADVKDLAESRAASQKATFDRAGETMATTVADGVKRLQEAFQATYRKEIDKIVKNLWGQQVQQR